MPDYIQIVKIVPKEGSRDFYRLQQAIVHIYARADSESEAKVIINDYLDRQEWSIIDVGKAGVIDTKAIPNSAAIRASLEKLGYCGHINYAQPPADIGFSKN